MLIQYTVCVCVCLERRYGNNKSRKRVEKSRKNLYFIIKCGFMNGKRTNFKYAYKFEDSF